MKCELRLRCLSESVDSNTPFPEDFGAVTLPQRCIRPDRGNGEHCASWQVTHSCFHVDMLAPAVMEHTAARDNCDSVYVGLEACGSCLTCHRALTRADHGLYNRSLEQDHALHNSQGSGHGLRDQPCILCPKRQGTSHREQLPNACPSSHLHQCVGGQTLAHLPCMHDDLRTKRA